MFLLYLYAEGLPQLLREATGRKKVVFTNCLKTAVKESDIIMISVGTPESKNGETDMFQIVKALKLVASYIENYKEITELTYGQAFVVGIFQALALIPGFSRSGASMTAGFWVGLIQFNLLT